MGRKIPGRKHQGVRDPEKQRKERFNRLKDKINAPPTNPDEQQVPKSLTRFVELKEKAKIDGGKRKKRDKQKPPPVFEQYHGETNKRFLYRIHKACEEVKKEAAFQQKYGVSIKKNPETGEIDVVKQPKDELEQYAKKLKKERKTKKAAKKACNDEPKLTKSQKRQKKLKEKKLKKSVMKEDSFEVIKDNVIFGETVHAPPTLTLPKKVNKDQCAPRPGRKQLLLTSLLDNNANTKPSKTMDPNKTTEKLKRVTKKTIDKKGKRKDLPHALRRQLETQQKEIIEAYKKIKSKKYQN